MKGPVVLFYLQGYIICVQQDIRLHYHKNNHHHYFISHSVAQSASLRSVRMSLNWEQTGLHGGTERALEQRPELLLPHASQQWRCMLFQERDTQDAQIHQSTYFQVLESHLPPTHAHKCMFYISPRWNIKTKAHWHIYAYQLVMEIRERCLNNVSLKTDRVFIKWMWYSAEISQINQVQLVLHISFLANAARMSMQMFPCPWTAWWCYCVVLYTVDGRYNL